MDYESRLSISYYREVAAINPEHHISLVQHLENHTFYVKKILDVYNLDIYLQLKNYPIKGIPRIYELYEEDARLTVIEEFVPGQTLDTYMTNHGTLPEEAVFDYIIQLCDILSQLHQLTPAIIHRDIKPSNIMLTPYGNIVLLDLNTAKYEDLSKNTDTILLGTKGYAAPEQYGFGSSTVQTDIYGIGVLLNILLTGELPSNQTSAGSYASLIKKSTQLRPKDRYSSIEAFKSALIKAGPKTIPSDLSYRMPQTSLSRGHQGSYLPPGYRSRNVFHMLLATFGYGVLLWLGMTLEVENASPEKLLIERFFFTLSLFAMVFFSGNYRNVQTVFPFCKSQNKLVRLIAIAAYDFLILLTLVLIMLILETFCV